MKAGEDSSKILSVSQVAKFLGVPEGRVEDLIARGVLPTSLSLHEIERHLSSRLADPIEQ